MTHPLFLAAALSFLVALSEWLCRHTWLRHLGSALLVIVLTAVVANLGVIPTWSADQPIYAAILSVVAELSIFLLLLQVNLRGILAAGLPMLLLFLLGALGTMAGVLVAMAAVGGAAAFGEHAPALGGMFVGTYVGGSVNFNAIALAYGVQQEGVLFAGASVVDSAMTTIWMAATVLFARILPHRGRTVTGHPVAVASGPAETADPPGSTALTAESFDRETVDTVDLGLALGLALLGVLVSREAADRLTVLLGFEVPAILILTTLALALAQCGPIHRLRGNRVLGMYTVMLFLAVIGTLCDVSALGALGTLGPRLMAFVTLTVAVHGVIVFGGSALLRQDPVMAAVASQANVGGATSALALARSLDRAELILPAILVGTLGSGVGTYLGLLTVSLLS